MMASAVYRGKAKDAAQRMIAQEPTLVGGFGCWLSTFTLAATEVTERAELPWLTLSYSDLITNRGFHYVFQTSPTADFQAESLVPTVMALAEKSTGKRPTKVGIIGDNTASSVSFYKPLHDHTLKDLKLDLVVEKIYTPPLSHATSQNQPERTARPDFVLLQSTNVPDDKQLMDKFSEICRPVRRQVATDRWWRLYSAVPELLNVTGADILEGLLVGLANWPGKEQAALSARFAARTKEPWFGHDSIFASRAHDDAEGGGAGACRRRRPAQGCGCAAGDGYPRRAGVAVPRPSGEIRRQGAARWRGTGDRAVARRQAGDGFAAEPGGGRRVLAEGLIRMAAGGASRTRPFGFSRAFRSPRPGTGAFPR